MARANYGLDSARDGQMVSSNGTEYTVNILWTASGDTTDMAFGSSGVQISYETADDKTKNSYILSSKCTIPFLVQNATDKAFILSLATTYQERDIWITVREQFDPGSTLFWCGYLLLDLKDEQDVSYPYEVTLTAVDGLAGLKDIPFVREENVDDSSVPTFPYVVSDTYYSAGFCNIIGSATTINWLQELIVKTGMVLAADDTGATSFLTNYTFQTAVNLYNEGHPVPAADVDPLRLSQLNMQKLYSIDDNGFVKVPNCYQVLEYICKNFGMRCVYWKHTFHFIEIDQYNTDSAAASTASVPINIPSRHYYYTGLLYNNYNYIGSTNLTPYDLTLENVSAPGEGLQKLAGTIYSGLPAIKTTDGLYFGRSTLDAYRGFPNLRYIWPTSGTDDQILLYAGGTFTSPTTSAGQVAYGTIVDAKDADGIKFNTYLSFKNTTTTDLTMRVMFSLIAKPSSQSHAFPFKFLYREYGAGTGEYDWQDWTTGGLPNTSSTAIGLWAKAEVTFPPAANIDQNVGILAYDTATDPWCANQNGLFPTDAAFSGSWDFTVVTWSMYYYNAANPLMGFVGQGTAPNYGSTANHGQISAYGSGTATNHAGTALSTVGIWQDLADYKYTYDNTLGGAGSQTAFMGTLKAVGGTISTATNLHVEVDVATKNSFIYDAGNYFWGDGATMKVSDDASTYVDAGDGKWVKPTYAWNAGTSQFDYTVGSYDKKLIELNLRDIMYNQSIALKQLNGTTALAETGKHYSGTSLMKYMNPIGKIIDLDSNQYQMMRGTFNLLLDEWNLTMNQVFYEVPSEAITVGEQPSSGDITTG